MKAPDMTVTLILSDEARELLDQLKRTGGAGSPSSDLLPDTRSGAGDKGAKLESASGSALPDQGSGELLLALSVGKLRAEGYRKVQKLAFDKRLEKSGERNRAVADELFSLIDSIEKALGEPMPQSVADGDGKCQLCGGSGRIKPKWECDAGIVMCIQCNGTGSPKQRSVSGNARSMAAPACAPNFNQTAGSESPSDPC